MANSEQADLEKSTGSNDYVKALVLAQRKELCPSITRGFLWEVLPHTLVYDAHTIGGWSGGPVLDRQGRVIGINTAYLSGFRAINYGIPIRFGQELLQGRGQEAEGPSRELPRLDGTDEGRQRSRNYERKKVRRAGLLFLSRDISPRRNSYHHRRIAMSKMKSFESWLVAAAIVMMAAIAWADDSRIAVAADAAAGSA